MAPATGCNEWVVGAGASVAPAAQSSAAVPPIGFTQLTLPNGLRVIAIRDTKSRWGSCSSTGTLSFSWRLIMAPPLVLDYLAAHEVAHLKELNHSNRFWTLLHELCPATDEAERWLKRHGAELHRYG